MNFNSDYESCNVAHWHEAHYSAILQSEYDSISFPNDMAFLAQQLK